MYTRYYGLQLRPFENNPDPRFLFLSQSHREALASLRYGIDHFKGFILIAGGIGTGKTTMIYSLLRHIDSSYVVIKIANPKWTFDEIIQYLALKLNISITNKNNLLILEELQESLSTLDHDGKRVVLIIDESHLLPKSTLEEIRLLSNLEKENRKLIQIVLVGQDEIYQTLESESLKTFKQRIMINRRIAPLSRAETGEYINHRLRIAGRTKALFSKNALSKIWSRSQGVPRVINIICDNALLIGYALDVKLIGLKIVNEAIHDIDSGFEHAVRPFSSKYKESKIEYFGLGAAMTALVAVIVYCIINIFFISPLSNLQAEEVTQLQQNRENPQQANSLNNDGEQEIITSSLQKVSPPIDRPTDLLAFSKTALNSAIQNESISIPAESVGKENNLEMEKTEQDAPGDISSVTQKVKFTPMVVKPNDNLWKIAKETYGGSNSTIMDHIQMANTDISKIDRIYVGQTIQLPIIQKDNLIRHDEKGVFNIHYASFYNLEDATACAAELVEKAKKSFVVPAQQKENKVYRVYCGNYKTYKEARDEIENLHLKYLDFLN